MNLYKNLKTLGLKANYTQEELYTAYQQKLEELNQAYKDLTNNLTKNNTTNKKKELIIDKIILRIICEDTVSKFTVARVLSILDEIKEKALNNQISLKNLRQIEKLKLNDSIEDIMILYLTLNNQNIKKIEVRNKLKSNPDFIEFLKSFFDDQLLSISR